MQYINPAIPLVPGSSVANGGGTGTGSGNPATSSSVSGNSGVFQNTNQNTSPGTAGTTAAIALSALGGSAAYGAAMFLLARRYKARKQNHRRSSSLLNPSEMRHSGSPVFGGAIMSGGRTTPGNERNSRGSGGTGNSARTQQISAPMMAENSLGWNWPMILYALRYSQYLYYTHHEPAIFHTVLKTYQSRLMLSFAHIFLSSNFILGVGKRYHTPYCIIWDLMPAFSALIWSEAYFFSRRIEDCGRKGVGNGIKGWDGRTVYIYNPRNKDLTKPSVWEGDTVRWNEYCLWYIGSVDSNVEVIQIWHLVCNVLSLKLLATHVRDHSGTVYQYYIRFCHYLGIEIFRLLLGYHFIVPQFSHKFQGGR